MKKSKEEMQKLYRLEYLVKINGDKREIERLREELNLGTSGIEFNPERYKKLVLAGFTLPEIANELGMSKSTLYKFRKKYGLVRFGGFR